MAPTLQWSFGPFRLDAASGCLWRDDALIALSPKPAALLACLVAQAGEVVPKAALLEAVWPETAVTEGVLKTAMGRIRQVLGESARTPQFIETIPRRGYRFIAPVTPATPPETPTASPALTPPAVRLAPGRLESAQRLVGRDAELAQLQMSFTRACQGERQVVFITGEAGIGKTTVIDTFVTQLESTADVWIGRGQCIEHYGAGEPYLPLLEALGRLGRGPQGARVVAVLRQQAPSWLVHLPALITPEESAALQMRVGSATRERMLRELAEAIETLTAVSPLIVVLEDLHWSDVSTVEWVAYVARRRDPARLFVVGTYRSVEAITHNHPVRTVTQDLHQQGQGSQLVLGYLTEAHVTVYLTQRFGDMSELKRLSRLLHQRTHGHPLYLVMLVDDIVRHGGLSALEARWGRSGEPQSVVLEVPESLRHMIERQLEQLAPEDQTLLEAASIAGVEFAAAIVAAAVDDTVEAIEVRCDALARQGLFVHVRDTAVWPDGTVTAHYGFRHALYQEVFYERVSVSRRARWHGQIGVRLELGYGMQGRQIAAELAEHFVRGQDVPRAVHYLHVAGENALLRHAYREAIAYLNSGIDMLQRLTDTSDRAHLELAFYINLGPAMMATKGFAAPEVAHAYSRARQLCQHMGESSQLLPVLVGLRRCYGLRAEFQKAQELGEELLTMAQHMQEPTYLLEAHAALGFNAYWRGKVSATCPHFDQAITLYGAQRHRVRAVQQGPDTEVACWVFRALATWLVGYPDRALHESHKALRLAHDIADPHTMAYTLYWCAIIHQRRGEIEATQEKIQRAMALSREHGLSLMIAAGMSLEGWTHVREGRIKEGLDQICRGVEAEQETECFAHLPYSLALLAESYWLDAQMELGLAVLGQGIDLVESMKEHVHAAELYRLKGELLLAQEGARQKESQVEACLRKALEVARGQQAKSLELRATASLAGLLRRQGKRAEARDLLSRVYGGFTEGFDTLDLHEAKILLDELSK